MFKGLNMNDPFAKFMIYLAEAKMGDEDAKGILKEMIKELRKTRKAGSIAFAKFIESQL